MSDLNVYVVSVIETYEREVTLRVHADHHEEAIEEALTAYVDTNAAVGNWSDMEKIGVRAVLVRE